MKNRLSWIALVLLLIAGVSLLAFPFVSDFLYWQAANVEIHEFDIQASAISDEEIDQRVELAHIYNSTLMAADLIDPYSEDKQDQGRRAYAEMLEVNEQIGYVTIPKIQVKLPMFAGTNESVLQKGVGHLEGTSLPVGGEHTHAVLTAHRGLPTANLFTDLDQLVEGDVFYVDTIQGTLAYKVIMVSVIEPSDFSSLEVVPGEDLVTLLTCTPYMINSHRLIVRGERTDYVPEAEEEVGTSWQPNMNSLYVRWGIYGLVGLVFVVILIFGLPRWRKRH